MFTGLFVVCYGVYKTAMIMAGAATPPVLIAYTAFVEGMAQQFGHGCWSLLHQSENRFRRELMEIIKLTQSDERKVTPRSRGYAPVKDQP